MTRRASTARFDRLQHGRRAAPVGHVHLGLGNFFRAHQAWYTEHAPDAAEWGIAAFGGRGQSLADTLGAQDGLYTLVTRGSAHDAFEVVSSLSSPHAAADHDAWSRYFCSPHVRVVTMTVTEAGYVRDADGGLDRGRPEVLADVETLRRRSGAHLRTAPAKLVAGLLARRDADAGPITLMSCDNVPDNGNVVTRVVRDLTEMVDPSLQGWLDSTVSAVTTMIDRITPRSTEEDRATVETVTGIRDRAPVVTEPFREWVLSGSFPGGLPRWEGAGARFADEITPFEQRKLWLLNGGHSSLAYNGLIRGHQTIAQAVADDTCRHWLEGWWREASAHLTLPAEDLAAYRSALLDRFANPRIHHRLDQIAADGSQKLPLRILPALRLERAGGRLPTGATVILGAWIGHLRGAGGTVADARAEEFVALAAGSLEEAVRRVLGMLDPSVGGDDVVVSAVVDCTRHLSRET